MPFWDRLELIEYYSRCGIDLPDKKEYGYSPENPIKASSVYNQYLYLSRLRYNGKPVFYERIGFYKDLKGNITDKFLIRVNVASISHQAQRATQDFVIYINTQSDRCDEAAPAEFTLVE